MSRTSMSVSARPASALTAMRLCGPRPTNWKTFLPSRSRRGAHAAAAQDAAVAVDEDVRMQASTLRLGNMVRDTRRRDAEPVGQGLQLAVAALLAEHAEVVALDEQHVDEVPPHGLDLGHLVLDHVMPWSDRLGAGRLRPAVDQHRADAAAAVGAQLLVVAEPRDVDARLRRPPPGWSGRARP